MFVVYFRFKSNGYFLYGKGDEACGYGGTAKFSEAAKFKTARKAREIGIAYQRMSRADPDTTEVVILKQA